MKPADCREDLVAAQRQSLIALLDGLLPSNRFYQERIGSSISSIQRGEATLGEILEQLPFTTKARLTEDHRKHPPFGTNLTFPLDRYTRCHQTSGTGGFSMRWLDTPESWDWMLGNWEQVYSAAGVTSKDRIYFAFSFGPFLGFWTAFEAGVRMGCLCLPSGGLSSVARVRAIVETGSTVLCCTPTYALHLGGILEQEVGAKANSKVQRILVAGEPGGSVSTTRRRIEALWPGAQVFDHHGMTEIGPVTYPCPTKPGTLHILERAFIPEILNPTTLEPAAPGELGELVLTNLGRLGSPLLRYRTGDLVRSAALGRCDCGSLDRGLTGGILGRLDDMVTVRGVNLYPSSVDEVIQRIVPGAEYQVHVQTSPALTEARLRIELGGTAEESRSMLEKLEAELRNAFCLRFEMEWIAPGGLPRSEHKAKRWIREDASPLI